MFDQDEKKIIRNREKVNLMEVNSPDTEFIKN